MKKRPGSGSPAAEGDPERTPPHRSKKKKRTIFPPPEERLSENSPAPSRPPPMAVLLSGPIAAQYTKLVVDKDGADVWSYRPFTITSKFFLNASKTPNADGYTHDTETCGLGWKFGFTQPTPNNRKPSNISAFLYTDVLPIPCQLNVSCVVIDGRVRRSIPATRVARTVDPSVTSRRVLLFENWNPQWLTIPFEPAIKTLRLEISLSFPPTFHLPTPQSLPVTSPFAPAVLSSITTGGFADIKFVFPARQRGSQLPRELFASSKLVKGRSRRLDALISSSTIVSSLASGEYDEDSDFEVDDIPMDLAKSPDVPTMPSTSRSQESISINPGPSSDASLTPKSPSMSVISFTSSASLGDLSEVSANDVAGLDFNSSPAGTGSTAAPFNGRVITVEGFGYRTWKAFLRYLYVGEIDFAALLSEETRTLSEHSCSPKSMYRLADKFDLFELKTRSLAAVKSGVDAKNVALELFSKFTELYPELQKHELDLLLGYSFEEVWGLEGVMKDALDGKLSSHGKEIILEIMKRSLTKST